MRNKFVFLGIMAFVLFGMGILADPALAKVGIGGKIETNFAGSYDYNDEFTASFLQHLNLELLLPRWDETSATVEFDLYYRPDYPAMSNGGLTIDLSKLYIKHRFEKMHLTVGKQPISWSFGSMLNPVNFSVMRGLTNLDQEDISEVAMTGYFPVAKMSSLTAVGAFYEHTPDIKLGLRGRTEFNGFDLALSYVREPWLEIIPGDTKKHADQRVAFTGKGDLGPISVYGATGYFFTDTKVSDGDPLFLVGADYSFKVGYYGNKIVTQVEYLHDKAGRIQNPLLDPNAEPDLILGRTSYEIDEFSGVQLMAVVNPKDKSGVIMPEYHNLIGSNLDVSIGGGIYFGQEDTQFGPKEIMPGFYTPKGMVNVTFGYQF